MLVSPTTIRVQFNTELMINRCELPCHLYAPTKTKV